MGEEIGDGLNGDVAIQLRVANLGHLAHAAATMGGWDFVGAEASASG